MTRSRFRFVVDSREKRPYQLASTSMTKALSVGDYSLVGFENEVALERKGFNDLYSCLTRERKRFRAQLKRLGALPFGALVIDSSPDAIILGHPRCNLPGPVALERLLAWTLHDQVSIYFAGRLGPEIVRTLLREWYKQHNGK